MKLLFLILKLLQTINTFSNIVNVLCSLHKKCLTFLNVESCFIFVFYLVLISYLGLVYIIIIEKQKQKQKKKQFSILLELHHTYGFEKAEVP